MPKRRNIEEHPLRKKALVGHGKGKLQSDQTEYGSQRQAKLNNASIRVCLEEIEKQLAVLLEEKRELEGDLVPTDSPGLMDHELRMAPQLD
jgi:hypothetical protein